MKIFVLTKGIRRHTINRLKTGFIPITNCDEGEDLPNVVRLHPPDLGLATLRWMRDWVEKNLVELGEWYVMLDDNIREIVTTHPEWWNFNNIDSEILGLTSSEIRLIYEYYLPGRDWPVVFQQIIDKAEELGTTVGGLSYLTNPLWRKKRWVFADCVCSKVGIYKRNDVVWWKPQFPLYHDCARSLQAMAHYGSVAILNHAFPDSIYHEDGGIGSFEARRELILQSVTQMAQEFPGMYEVSGSKLGTMLIKNVKKLQEWRREHGYIE